MTDITKYRNVSLTHETYKTLISLSKVLLPDAQLSISKTIESIANEKAKKLNGKVQKNIIYMQLICPDCNGNGYVKAVLEEGREHVVLYSVRHASRKEKYMWMSPKLWSLISMLIILQIMLASCTRDLSPNPYTSILRWAITHE